MGVNEQLFLKKQKGWQMWGVYIRLGSQPRLLPEYTWAVHCMSFPPHLLTETQECAHSLLSLSIQLTGICKGQLLMVLNVIEGSHEKWSGGREEP